MRPKIVILVLVAGLAGVAVIFLIKHQVSPPQAAAPTAITETVPAAVQTAPTITSVPPPAPVPVAAAPVAAEPAATNAPISEQRQAAIDAETDRLQQWSMNDDPASLSNILAALTSPEKEVREAAIEAAEQFGSTNAIPTLEALAANTTDLAEQSALLEAAHFISLPSIFDTPMTPEQIQAAAQRKAERGARRQAQTQNPAHGQNSPAPPNP
jgi:hypothetical protein